MQASGLQSVDSGKKPSAWTTGPLQSPPWCGVVHTRVAPFVHRLEPALGPPPSPGASLMPPPTQVTSRTGPALNPLQDAGVGLLPQGFDVSWWERLSVRSISSPSYRSPGYDGICFQSDGLVWPAPEEISIPCPCPAPAQVTNRGTHRSGDG